MDDGIPSSSSDSAMTSKKKKNRRSTFKIQMKKYCLYLKAKDYALFKIRSKRPNFVLNPLKYMLNLVVDIISLQQLEYEMERADLPDDCIFWKLDIVVILPPLTHIFNLSKPLNEYFKIFRKNNIH